MNKLLCLIMFVIIFVIRGNAQMPPPGYERAVKMQMEREKMPRLERDSITRIDTVVIFDPNTYEEEVKVIISKISLKDYCTDELGMSNPDILLDGQPHKIIDPRTYEDLIIRLNEAGKIDTIPK